MYFILVWNIPVHEDHLCFLLSCLDVFAEIFPQLTMGAFLAENTNRSDTCAFKGPSINESIKPSGTVSKIKTILRNGRDC